MHRWLIYLNK